MKYYYPKDERDKIAAAIDRVAVASLNLRPQLKEDIEIILDLALREISKETITKEN